MKDKYLRILILEDISTDAELMESELRKGGVAFSSRCVQTKEDFIKELKYFVPDIILADYKLPSFDGLSALEIAKEQCLSVPFIFVSGAIGEDFAIETIKKGATDYVLKDRLSRLVPAINRALREAEEKNYEIHLTRVLLDAMDNGISEKRGHSKRIVEYSLLIARAINMSEDKKRRLYYASLLHDIGFLKIRIQDVISREEFKMHPQFAYEMLRQIHFYADIAPIVLHHHERYDGKGYPSGLKGEDIPLESRIIAIAEAFDAMVSKDSYKYIGKMINDDARPSVCEFGHAIEELKNNAGTQFDPQLVEEFANTVTPEHLCP